MEASYIKSLVFMIAYVFLFVQVFLLRKNNKKMNGAAWICITLVLTMWLNAMIAAIISLVNIPINLLSMSVIYILISIGLWFQNRKNGIQIYEWRLSDFIYLCIIVGIAFGICLKVHKYTLQLSYLTSDAAVHMRFALRLMESGSVKGYMFYAPVNNGLFMDVLSPFLAAEKYYKAFILADILMLALAGCVFFAVTREELKGRKQCLFGMLMSILYMLGYPLNNKLYGFVHLGMAVTVIIVIIYIMKLYLEDDISEKFMVILMLLGCHAVVMCYMLFAPVVYFAVLMVVLLKNKRSIFSKKVILQCFQIFLIPCILAIYYCYFQYFKAENIDPMSALSIKGSSYGEVYANYVFFLPIVIYMCIFFVKEKKHQELLVFFMFFVVFMCALLILVFLNKSSWYYFYKLHHVVWAVLCWIGLLGILRLYREQKEMLFSYGMVIIGLAAIWLLHIDEKIVTKEQEQGYAMVGESTAYFSVGFDIFNFNRNVIKHSTLYNKKKIELYNYAARELDAHNTVIPMFVDQVNFSDYFWYEDFIRKDLSSYYIWVNVDRYADEIFIQKNVEYVMVLYENPLYEQYKDLIESYEKVYENKQGCIIKLK